MMLMLLSLSLAVAEVMVALGNNGGGRGRLFLILCLLTIKSRSSGGMFFKRVLIISKLLTRPVKHFDLTCLESLFRRIIRGSGFTSCCE